MKTTRWDRRRGRQRGAVLVEAAVVIPVFILFLGGIIFVHQLLFRTLGAMQEARNGAWLQAMDRCKAQGGGAPTELMQLDSEMPNAPGANTSLTNPGGESVGTSTAVAQVTLDTGNDGQPARSFEQPISSQARVWCNDRTESGTVVGVFQWLLGHSD